MSGRHDSNVPEGARFDPPKDDGGPVFPFEKANGIFRSGMSLRDYFAAHAPEGPVGADITALDTNVTARQKMAADHAAWRYVYADAMLNARK